MLRGLMVQQARLSSEPAPAHLSTHLSTSALARSGSWLGLFIDTRERLSLNNRCKEPRVAFLVWEANSGPGRAPVRPGFLFCHEIT
jgi:hypothetical protein